MRCLRVHVATYCEDSEYQYEGGWMTQHFHIVGATVNTPMEVIKKAVRAHICRTEISKYKIQVGAFEVDLVRDTSPFGAFEVVLDLNGKYLPIEEDVGMTLEEALALAESL